jgi:hypothetical protein
MDIETGYVLDQESYMKFRNGTISDGSNTIWSCDFGSNNCTLLDGESDPFSWVCFPLTNYTWGFSYIWFLVNHCMIAVWAAGLYGVWVDAERNSMLQRRGRIMGKWRAILDLSGAIEEECGPNLNGYSNNELEQRLKTALPVRFTPIEDQVMLLSERRTGTHRTNGFSSSLCSKP